MLSGKMTSIVPITKKGTATEKPWAEVAFARLFLVELEKMVGNFKRLQREIAELLP